MTHRVLIVDRDARYRSWLQAHIGAILPDAAIEAIDANEFSARREQLHVDTVDLVLLGMGFGASPEDPLAEGLGLLRLMREQPGLPPIIALADEGNELTAIRALRLGAVDYLPKRLVTGPRLTTSIRVALRSLERHRTGSARAARYGGPAVVKDPPRVRPRPPRNLIPRYAILDTLGESDRAIVYLATSFELDALVALKVSRKDYEEPGAEIDQYFAREYEAIAAIEHPSIIDIYDYGVHDGHEFIAMEFFPRGDLKARLGRRISPDEAIDYVRKIASALVVVHAAQLVHRDLKPPNVMLRESNEIVLIDFGLARPMGRSTSSTQTGLLRGSPYYMSPEQAQGRTLDARTDLYALGIMLYEMLTGRKPFGGSTAIEVLQRHVSAPVPVLPVEHARFQPLIQQLLAKSPDERYASAIELIAALPPAVALDSEQIQLPLEDTAASGRLLVRAVGAS